MLGIGADDRTDAAVRRPRSTTVAAHPGDAMAPVAALGQLRASAGSQFDPQVVQSAPAVPARDLAVTGTLTGGEAA